MPVMGSCALSLLLRLLLISVLAALPGCAYRAAFSAALRRLALTYTVCMVA